MHERIVPEESFWALMIESGVCDAALAAELRHTLRTRPRQPLGGILVRQGYLTVRQIAEVLALQADEPEVRIGDLAVREGYCSREHIEAALQFQRLDVPSPIELLRKEPRVDNDALLLATTRYVTFLEQHSRNLERELASALGAAA